MEVGERDGVRGGVSTGIAGLLAYNRILGA